MKTSKIIFITLLGTIAVLILSAVLDVRINGQKRGDFLSNYKVDRQTIPSFKVLCINNSRNITLVQLVQNDSSYMEVNYRKDLIPPRVNFIVKDDTLRLTDFDKTKNPYIWMIRMSIHVSDMVQNIQLKNSEISIKNFSSEKLSLDLDKSSVDFRTDDGKIPTIDILNITARNKSDINAGIFNVDSLGIVLQHSEANLQVITAKISGSLSDSSKIYARQPLEISLKKDATSKINVSDY